MTARRRWPLGKSSFLRHHLAAPPTSPRGEVALRTCPDCGASPGFLHSYICDVARCLFSGRQYISCDFARELTGRHPHPGLECARDWWTGFWPGQADAVRLGLFCRPGPEGWEPCDPHDDDATPDLNRLGRVARWVPAVQRWELPVIIREAPHPLRRAHVRRTGLASRGDGRPPTLVTVILIDPANATAYPNVERPDMIAAAARRYQLTR